VNASAVLAATLLGSLCVSIAAGPQGQASAISVLGCLDRQQPHDFFLSDEEGNLYTLTGVTSDLIKHVGEEIRIEGTRDESTKPLPSLHVIGFQQVFTAPSPSLSSSFTNTAAWRTDRNQAYGLKFSHPESFPNSKAAVSANFPDDDGTATLGSFEMPSEIYAGTNFVGGSFTLSVPNTSPPQLKTVSSMQSLPSYRLRRHCLHLLLFPRIPERPLLRSRVRFRRV
jgi:hypothetical protein